MPPARRGFSSKKSAPLRNFRNQTYCPSFIFVLLYCFNVIILCGVCIVLRLRRCLIICWLSLPGLLFLLCFRSFLFLLFPRLDWRLNSNCWDYAGRYWQIHCTFTVVFLSNLWSAIQHIKNLHILANLMQERKLKQATFFLSLYQSTV